MSTMYKLLTWCFYALMNMPSFNELVLKNWRTDRSRAISFDSNYIYGNFIWDQSENRDLRPYENSVHSSNSIDRVVLCHLVRVPLYRFLSSHVWRDILRPCCILGTSGRRQGGYRSILIALQPLFFSPRASFLSVLKMNDTQSTRRELNQPPLEDLSSLLSDNLCRELRRRFIPSK